ncbi:calmodulin isoform X2 [Eurytemora carolleeae]|uniref:calmodulin isoform X2 n=1 Tax=Eurytemora carolleeae TaxID=1294199 RepID=UPI000C7950AB|nr:calmodulin isoform X2 [Eurytemora carolleeae]|eukprot:XP_023326248.1 calmodulin-like isoform X2 [Eurytemora affinis]
MLQPDGVVLSNADRMRIEKQKLEIKRMRLTKEQLELFRDTFVIFDKDGDGTIDTKELSTVLKSMGYNPTIEEIRDMVDQVDNDASGSIEFLEFLLLMGNIMRDQPSEADLRDVFTVFDKDRSGFVSSSEIKLVMGQLGL